MHRLHTWINNQNLNRKLFIWYTLGILLPLLLVDGLFILMIYNAEEKQQQSKMEAQAEAVEYNLEYLLDNASLLARNVRMNSYLKTYLAENYPSPYAYFKAYQNFIKGSFLDSLASIDSTTIQIYADNDTIISGKYFHTLSSVIDQDWMEDYRKSGQDMMLMFYYDNAKTFVINRRKVWLLCRLYNASGADIEQIVRINVDYNTLVRNLQAQHYEFPLYVCEGNRILYSSERGHEQNKDYELVENILPSIEFERDIVICGTKLRVILANEEKLLQRVLGENQLLFVTLLLLSIIFPVFFINLMGESIRTRIMLLADTFARVDSDTLTELPPTTDKDEIGLMMRNYNKMASRMNDLIETVYKNRLREQEINIAKQRAELLALRSQINPHFLFNALESIRMHSLLHEEYETARMVEKLAMMQRQNVDWTSDVVKLRQEITFLEAYLDLQKIRFGDRIRYQLEIGNCEDYLIPKLTLVTFVENAFIHGMEKSTTPSWIFVRVWEKEKLLFMEVEDTGQGMPEERCAQMNADMNGADITMLRRKNHVGIINACLRLKMITGGKARFEVESEEGIGTIIHIEMPIILQD